MKTRTKDSIAWVAITVLGFIIVISLRADIRRRSAFETFGTPDGKKIQVLGVTYGKVHRPLKPAVLWDGKSRKQMYDFVTAEDRLMLWANDRNWNNPMDYSFSIQDESGLGSASFHSSDAKSRSSRYPTRGYVLLWYPIWQESFDLLVHGPGGKVLGTYRIKNPVVITRKPELPLKLKAEGEHFSLELVSLQTGLHDIPRYPKGEFDSPRTGSVTKLILKVEGNFERHGLSELEIGSALLPMRVITGPLHYPRIPTSTDFRHGQLTIWLASALWPEGGPYTIRLRFYRYNPESRRADLYSNFYEFTANPVVASQKEDQ